MNDNITNQKGSWPIESNVPISNLPLEMINQIFLNLPLEKIPEISRVCQAWKSLAENLTYGDFPGALPYSIFDTDAFSNVKLLPKAFEKENKENNFPLEISENNIIETVHLEEEGMPITEDLITDSFELVDALKTYAIYQNKEISNDFRLFSLKDQKLFKLPPYIGEVEELEEGSLLGISEFGTIEKVRIRGEELEFENFIDINDLIHPQALKVDESEPSQKKAKFKKNNEQGARIVNVLGGKYPILPLVVEKNNKQRVWLINLNTQSIFKKIKSESN